MKNDWYETKAIFLELLKELVEKKIMTLHEIYSVDGIAGMFANKLSTYENEIIKAKEISQMIDALKEYFPDKYKKFLEK